MSKPLRLALFTLESLANARAVRRFIAAHAADIAMVGLSNPFRKNAGGSLGQTWRHLKRSGPRFLPYLAANFSLPRVRGLFAGHAKGPEDVPISDLAASYGIPTTVVDDLNGPEVARRLRESGADLIVSFHFDQIFNAETLSLTPMGGVNIHPSLLPRHRGPVPTTYAMMETPHLFGVTVHRLVPKIDAGAMLAQERSDLPAGISALHAAVLLHERGRLLLDGVLRNLAEGTQVETPFDPLLPYCPFLTSKQLADLARRGLKNWDWGDIRDALSLRVI
ncbi:MAG TPA: formyltransferase family protein [Stellaceae bacterium]|nr:formyltransferase family protein [Stellaceae bacterium]